MPTYTHNQFIAYLCRLSLHANTQKELAESLGISQAYLSDVMNGRRQPGKKMLEALRFRREVRYVELESEQ